MTSQDQSKGRTEYRNPPVIEIFIQVKFEPREGKVGWGRDFVEPFVQTISSEFGKRELVMTRQVTIEESEGQALPKIVRSEETLDRVRLFSRDSTWCFQVGDDMLACNLRRMEDTVPRYTNLRPLLEYCLKQYCSHFNPRMVEWQALSYVDLIRIPPGQFDLGQYFKLSLNVPNIYGTMGALNLQCSFEVPNGSVLALRWQDVSGEEQQTAFRLFWMLSQDSPCEIEEVLSRADQLHEVMSDYFEAMLTDDCRKLFEEQ